MSFTPEAKLWISSVQGDRCVVFHTKSTGHSVSIYCHLAIKEVFNVYPFQVTMPSSWDIIHSEQNIVPDIDQLSLTRRPTKQAISVHCCRYCSRDRCWLPEHEEGVPDLSLGSQEMTMAMKKKYMFKQRR